MLDCKKALKIVLDKYTIEKEDVAKYYFLNREGDSFPDDTGIFFLELKNGQKIFEDFSGGYQ